MTKSSGRSKKRSSLVADPVTSMVGKPAGMVTPLTTDSLTENRPWYWEGG